MSILADENRCIKNLRANIEMDSTKFKLRLRKNHFQYLVQSLFIHAKWRGATAHGNGPALGLSGRVDADRYTRAAFHPTANRCDALRFGKRFHVDLSDTMGENELEGSFRFTWAGKQNSLRCAARFQGPLELSSRSDFEPAAATKKMFHNGGRRIGFYGVVDGKTFRQGRTERVVLQIQHGTVIDKNRGPICLGELANLRITDDQGISGPREILRRESCRQICH